MFSLWNSNRENNIFYVSFIEYCFSFNELLLQSWIYVVLVRFPKNGEIRKVWLENLKIDESVDVEKKRICKRHFSDEDFWNSGSSGCGRS